MKIFFEPDNEYIRKSDKSIYFFFVPKILKILVSEYLNTDQYRWKLQAQMDWIKKLKPVINEFSYEDIENQIKSKVKFGVANKERDKFILNHLIKKVEEHLKNA